MTDAFTKSLRLGRNDYGYGSTRLGSTFVTIKWDGKRLSITGVEGPKTNGDCMGGAGQIVDHLAVTEFAPGWDAAKIEELAAVWKRWHLNDLKAGNPAQEEWLRANPVSYVYPQSHYEEATKALDAAGLNPQGDRYGHKWNHEDVPADVLEWLQALPDADIANPWRD